uniref:Putative transcriptional regulator (AraC family) n=1 Tax=mine drainage metagenome TaxID=410659 RepID=E6PPA7_9ZZZZ
MSQVRPNTSAYVQRFSKVFEYIDAHLDDDLSVESLSQLANFSKFHFDRQFSAYTGISVFKYVQLMRLRRASHRLAFHQADRILDIALDTRFESPEAFARAFKRTFGQTPSEFRRKPEWHAWSACFVFPNLARKPIMNVKIVDFPEARVAALEHRGHIGHLNETVRAFIDWRQQTGLSPVQASRTFGIPYSNPDTTPPDEFRFDVCGEVAALVPDNPQGVRNKIIPAGRCAVVRHLGSPDRIGETIDPLYRDWLPKSGKELRDFPLFFHYLSVYPETPEYAWQTDVHLPLK